MTISLSIPILSTTAPCAADVERILRLAVDYGLFDAGLFEKCGILTSVEIQRQYLFSTHRRDVTALEAAYRLVKDEQPVDTQQVVSNSADDNVTLIKENVTLITENVTSGTHSIAQNSTA